jgi:TolB-like protein
MSFWDELRRRNVFRVGIAYAVASWVLLQVLDVIGEILELPAWGGKLLLAIIVVGFFVTLFVSWAYELTPEGIKRESEVDRSQSITPRTGRKLDRLIIVLLLLALGYFVVDKFVFGPTRDAALLKEPRQATAAIPAEPSVTPAAFAANTPSIAVLPFVNMSDDKDYFADGLSEELLNMLAKMPGLKVAGRTSSFMFKGRNEDLREIGQALGVANVLEGSVRRSGERLRITAQLVKVDDGFHIWSETYDRQMADVFDIQDDVARAISEALKVHLLPPDDRPTENTEAYALYLEAVAMMQGADWSRVLEVIDTAIALDPGFAKAWELKAAYYWWTGNGTIANSEAQRPCYEAATHALALDPDLVAAQAYAASSEPETSFLQEYDALTELVRLQPSNVIGISTLHWDMIYMGYFERALEVADQGLAIDPLSPTVPAGRGNALMALGRRQEAHEAWQLSVDRGDPVGALWLAWTEIQTGNDLAGVAWLDKWVALRAFEPWDARAFVANARDPVTGKAFLDAHLKGVNRGAFGSSAELSRSAIWYLVFGYVEDFWRALEQAGIFGKGWTDAGIALNRGMVLHDSGFTAHPIYQRYANQFLAQVWEVHGAPDLCSKSQELWHCE